MRLILFLAAFFMWFGSTYALATDPQTVTVLDAELVIDMKRNPHDPDPEAEVRRARYVTAQVRKALDMTKYYEVVALSEAEETVAELKDSYRYLHDCNNCEIRIGRRLDTDLIVNLWIQKVSNLIINLNLVVKNVETGEPIMTSFIDIRGNTDNSWKNGTTYLLKKFFNRYHDAVPADLDQAESVWPQSG